MVTNPLMTVTVVFPREAPKFDQGELVAMIIRFNAGFAKGGRASALIVILRGPERTQIAACRSGGTYTSRGTPLVGLLLRLRCLASHSQPPSQPKCGPTEHHRVMNVSFSCQDRGTEHLQRFQVARPIRRNATSASFRQDEVVRPVTLQLQRTAGMTGRAAAI